ncbi:MAG: SAF domain-containing protein [Solirubrobacterales bacterium]
MQRDADKRPRRFRFLLLGGASLLCGGVAASIVQDHESRVRSQVGPLIPVLVAAREIPRGKLLGPSDANRVVQRRIPARFVPRGALRTVSQALGYRALAPLAVGDYVTSSVLAAPSAGSAETRLGATDKGRLVQVAVAGGAFVLEQTPPGSLVDVLVTSDRGGAPRTYLALQRVRLAQAAPPGDRTSTSGTDQASDAVATLRVSLRQAIVLTAAQNFAREVRLVPRSDGDRRLLSPLAVTSSDLRP